MTRYRIAGITTESAIELPGVMLEVEPNIPAEVRINWASVPDSLGDAASQKGPSWEFSGNRFLLRVPGIARFLLSGGCEIAVEREPDGDSADAAIFLVGTVFGILLHQRGQIALHASAVRVNGKAVLFLGVSGAGKSTMAAVLGQRGYPLVSDDLCAVTIHSGQVPMIHPDGRRLKLWTETISTLDLASRRGSPVRRRLEKFYVEPDETFAEPLPVGAVYALLEARAPDLPGIISLNLPEAALRLRRNAYRPLLVGRMDQKAQYFQAVAAIAGNAGIFDLRRELDFARLPEIVGWLEQHWSDIGLTAP